MFVIIRIFSEHFWSKTHKIAKPQNLKKSIFESLARICYTKRMKSFQIIFNLLLWSFGQFLTKDVNTGLGKHF